MKTFEPKSWVVPQPVLIIGTYIQLGDKVGNAFSDGKALKESDGD